jgi:hypothetical protein
MAVSLFAAHLLVAFDALKKLRRLRTDVTRPRTTFGVKTPSSANARLNAADADLSSRSA